jgi:hypothetical protein
MMDEQAQRRATFVEGTPIRLADGQTWTLPALGALKDDPMAEGLLRAIGEAESEPERLRDELALTICLLSRNYHLKPEAYPEVLGFRPGDAAQGELRRTVRRIALEALGIAPGVELEPNHDRKARPLGSARRLGGGTPTTRDGGHRPLHSR